MTIPPPMPAWAVLGREPNQRPWEHLGALLAPLLAATAGWVSRPGLGGLRSESENRCKTGGFARLESWSAKYVKTAVSTCSSPRASPAFELQSMSLQHG